MKCLLLVLVLGVAGALGQGDLITEGAWNTYYMAATDGSLIRENGPMRIYMRQIDCGETCATLTFVFYVRENGVCSKRSVVATEIENGRYVVEFKGKNYFLINRVSEFEILISDDHRNTGQQSIVLGLVGRAPEVTEEGKLALTRVAEQSGIPSENIVYIADTDTCPPV
ncbi:male-specific submandibular salivary gland protein-like [Erinaceus europaeus]|uniref:Male-specific submandibular salivary gland protein-like n=1 Tax=Erinaceus europaeus TaxID=9365 RepID=A0ABM3WPN6_ERIEU|nr:male-specific submandibular salivary gland protein-like [Erinaceus europaeus]